eukprot:CAMPEP_0184966654 /NCGR_PEP_ID=MMETSP1098-20130426/267_1 /TAXON_ID=89044 /ORGANISM="Spumella elongata, Strain CCAP 955/1" /LENGTH=565 /DNA_ID=CAMNT_0027487967 /DNA_START=213 /DNA_END=1910 /DNA_ORIENTATION=+
MAPRSGKKPQPAGKGKVASGSTGDESKSSEQKQIEQLQRELQIKTAALNALSAKVDRLEDGQSGENIASVVRRRHHPVVSTSNLIGDKGRQKVKMGTRGSITTQHILEAAGEPSKTPVQLIAERFLKMFSDPTNYISYLQSKSFAQDLSLVCQEVSNILEQQPRCLFLQSPVYVFGDIHGNLEDLHFFADNIWKMGMDLTAGKFLFLGDYVDRGMSCLECVAYLFGLKILFPHKIDLLRGNHETRDVNGWEMHYMEKSFLHQCKERFGVDVGEQVWEDCNQAFDRLPLAAVIDHEIFCIHGGFPRPIRIEDSPEGEMQTLHKSEIESILALPKVISIMPAYDHESDWMKQVATDCIWSDPASEDMENGLDEDGFGDSPRGGGAVCFGGQAIDNFLAANNLSYIIRAHEAHAYGVALSKGARVFTVFSTSKDHRQGERAMAGCILVDNDKIQVINRSPQYKNKYVHRRTSVSLENLSSTQMEERRKLGLVRFSLAMDDMRRLVDQVGFAEHEDSDVDEEADSARQKSAASARRAGLKATNADDSLIEDLSEMSMSSQTETHRPSFG